MSWLVAVSKSRLPASVTTPVVSSIANRPPALSVNEYVTALVVASASEAEAVIPTSAPLSAASESVFAASLLSTGVDTTNSSTSLIVMVKVETSLGAPLAGVAWISSVTVSPIASRSIAPATVTSPLVELTANKPKPEPPTIA